MASTSQAAYRRPAVPGVRWDRLGRIAMLLVLAVLLYLYLGAARAYLATRQQANSERSAIAALKRDNAALRQRRNQLMSPGTLEAQARGLGMIRPGERPYIIEGLPSH